MAEIDYTLFVRGIKKGIARGLNLAAAGAKKQLFREISRKYGITEKDARKYISKRIRIDKATPENLRATLRTTRYGKIPLIAFRTRQTPAGTSVEILRGQPEIFERAFIQKGIRSGKVNVFRRVEKSKVSESSSRRKARLRKTYGARIADQSGSGLVGRYPITTVIGVHHAIPFAGVAPDVEKLIMKDLDTYIEKGLKKEIALGQVDL